MYCNTQGVCLREQDLYLNFLFLILVKEAITDLSQQTRNLGKLFDITLSDEVLKVSP